MFLIKDVFDMINMFRGFNVFYTFKIKARKSGK